jgi:hypothetical protein
MCGVHRLQKTVVFEFNTVYRAQEASTLQAKKEKNKEKRSAYFLSTLSQPNRHAGLT